MSKEKVLTLSLLFVTVLVSGCTVSSTTQPITNPDQPNPVILNKKTQLMSERTPNMDVEQLGDGEITVEVKNKGETGDVGTVIIFENKKGNNVNSTAKIMEFQKGEEKTVTLDVEKPQAAETYYIFVSDSQPK